ncbi:MAG: heavy-metal-associated domain-containing protein, partial [Sphingomonadaceae bacterium]|nr:heavy-metal-associated domain-containing protein [Sphingomonadaceae bacterium]
FSVQYETPDVASVGSTEAAVRGIAGVRFASTGSLALGGISVMRVTYAGDMAALKAALSARGFRVQEGGGALRISR